MTARAALKSLGKREELGVARSFMIRVSCTVSVRIIYNVSCTARDRYRMRSLNFTSGTTESEGADRITVSFIHTVSAASVDRFSVSWER